jgi:histidinol-phosphate aminotransferase
MKLASQELIHPKVQNLQAYLPGKSIQEIQEKFQLKNVIKLASNENAWGCSPNVLSAIQATTLDDISVYPNTYIHPFFKQLSHSLEVPGESIFITNGSDAIFSLLIQAYAYPQQKAILTHQYAFMGYETQANAYGLDCVKVSVDAETWELNIQDFVRSSQQNIAIIFIANPNNPTGTYISWDKIEYILINISPNILLVIDEAYYEYQDNDEHPNLSYLLKTYPNLVITRTFSKAYGLASLRLGYAIAHPELVKTLKKIQLPFTINQIALNAGFASINDFGFLEYTKKQTNLEKKRLHCYLQEYPIKCHKGFGNFVTIELETDSMALVTYLESQGIIIRPLHAFGLKNCARITIGQHQQNILLKNKLAQYFI